MKVSSSCYAVLGLGYSPPWVVNSGFIVGSKSTMIIDAGPSYIAAQTIYGYAHNVRPQNKIFVINTEKHLDHIAGNCFFREKGIDVYGYEGINRSDAELKQDIDEWNNSILNKTRRAQHEEEIFFEKTHIVNPNKLVKENDMFDLGGVTAEILSTKGHTQTNISVYVKNEQVLFTGDCIVGKYIPNLGSGNVKDWNTWIDSLEMILQLDLKNVVPGHGNILAAEEIKTEIERIKNLLSKAIESGMLPA
jgi:glyoxylase-like metal-dependent hydrolase (beta-lactamase superfamily II)